MSFLDEIKQKCCVNFRPTIVEPSQSQRASPALNLDKTQLFPLAFLVIAGLRCSISDILVRNTGAVPGDYAHPYGYVVFATTLYGDAFCSDTRAASGKTSPVVRIAHDLEPDNDEIKREDLAKLAKPIAVSFESFLNAFASETLDTKPLYPTRNE